MLQGINRLGRSWVGRVIVTVMFGFLIISFAIWGIGDIFRGGVRTQVARVGGTDIPAEVFRSAYQNDYQNLIRRTGRSITPDLARALGIEQRVISRLVSEAAFDRETRNLGLAVPDSLVIRSIQADPSFQGPGGRFDRGRFIDLLRQAGYGEAQFVTEQRAVVARQQLAEGIAGGIGAPLSLREAVHRYQTERRAADYATLGAGILGELAPPTDEALQTYYNDRKGTYRSPEFRSASLMIVTPDGVAKPEEVSDDDARAYYERTKTTRFGTPEKRTIQQIVFPTKAEAEAASAKIKDGTTFEALAGERGLNEAGLALGTLTRAEMFDPATAEAAFSLAEGAVSGPVDGRFGTVLLRVTKVEGGQTKSWEEAAPEARRHVAVERAKSGLQALHDAIEDQRVSGKSLTDIARERNRLLELVPEVDRQGNDKAGKPFGSFPERAFVLAAMFRSDIGADAEPVRTPDGGYVWLEVTKIEPPRERPLAEVRDRVVEDWRKSEVARLLSDKARELAERVDKGEDLAAVAGSVGAKVETAADLGRSASGALPATVVTRIFATPVGRAGSAAGQDESTRVLFKVTAATAPPFVTTTQEAGAIETQLKNALAEDVLAEYMSDLEKRIGVQVYPENMRRAIGGEG